MTTSAAHTTVLIEEAVAALSVEAGGTYIDATFGRGGHSRQILQQLGDDGRLLVLDRDPQAIAVASELAGSDARVSVMQGTFTDLETFARQQGVHGQVNGILFDLGVSSPQLDEAQRGFSFSKDGPLDMRMDPGQSLNAADWINSAKEKEIARVLYEFGEERHSRRMARRIVEERQQEPIRTTARLAEIVKQANPAWEKDKHPATRAFQGIRIFINSELDQVSSGLEQALAILAGGGRLVVISFHSLEDRIVKKFINLQTKGDNFPRDLPVPQSMLNPKLRSLGKARRPGAAEVAGNPRARSAVMRVAEKLT